MGRLVETRDLSFRYSGTDRWVLQKIDLDIDEGEIVILAGPSGCGKSTFLRCMNGLIPYMFPGEYRGSVTVNGFVVDKSQMSVLAQNIGFLFQNPENQIFMFAVERDIAFGPENLGMPRDEIRTRVDESMRLLGIQDLALRAPHELSDGQKQRVALAGVIAMRPKLIILDEPTSLLDPRTASELVLLIQRLNKELGITFMIVEHRLDLLIKIASRMVVMSDGSKVLDGRPVDVLSDDRVEPLGVLVPPVPKLHSLLTRDGLFLGEVPLTPEELTEELRRFRR